MNDYNLQHMKQLLGKDNVSVVYLQVNGDYWIRQEEFCKEFQAVPLSNNVVIHVRYEGLSLTNSEVVTKIEKIIKDTGRNPDSVYVFSPNSIKTDSPWHNLFWNQYQISDEFIRSESYWCDTPTLDNDIKTFALFIGRRTTPRLFALYSIWKDEWLNDNFLLSAMNHPELESALVFDDPEKVYDRIDDWIVGNNNNKMQRILEQTAFRSFCQALPITSIDGYSITDQYTETDPGENRNNDTVKSLIRLGSRYLFELTFETMTRGTTFTPSEKTVRTIVAKKPLIVYAPQNFLLNLQNLGFKTFNTLWDESYDQLEGLPRFNAMMKIVREICKLPQSQQLQLYQESRSICDYNRELLEDYAWKHGVPRK